MRIVYIGVVDFSYHCLETVLQSKGNVVGIVTCKQSAQNSDYKDLTPIALKKGIPVHYFKNINDSTTLQWIEEKQPDVIFCWGVSQLLKPPLLSLAPMGVIGFHPALLPRNRGRHPIIWALALGLEESGSTFFFMDEGADSGPILSQKRFGISDTDNASTVYEKIKELAKLQIKEFLPELISGNYKTKAQDHEKANYWRKRTREDGRIDFRMSTKSILNLVRALDKPYPGAEIIHQQQRIVVWEAKRYEGEVEPFYEPGRVLKVLEGTPTIKCCDGAVTLTQFEPHVPFVEGGYL